MISIIADACREHRDVVVPQCDVLTDGGDASSFGCDEAAIFADADAWIAAQAARHGLVVGGNHDFALAERTMRFAAAMQLEDALIEVEGLRRYGAPRCSGSPGIAHALDGAALARRWRRIPEGIDIRVTHVRPRSRARREAAGRRRRAR